MRRDKSGKTWYIVTLVIMTIAIGIGYAAFQGETATNLDLENVPVFEVKRGGLKISVVETGTIRPRDEVILRNEAVDDTKIIYIVDEGIEVKKGDLLVELDATAKEDRLVTEQLELQNDQAELISARENMDIVRNQAQSDIDQAELLYKFAQQDLEKYKNGEYPKQLKEAEVAITLASQEYALAKEDLKWSEILYEKKYLAESELQQDQLSAKRAQLNLDLAIEDLGLLENYTHIRQLEQLNSDVKQNKMELERTKTKATANIVEASARLYWRQERVQRVQNYVNELQSDIKAAKIYAPIDGLALYASSVLEDWEDDEDRIRLGAEVDERREILFLTAAEEYNIDILIQETDLNKVGEGLDANITVDALPDVSLKGIVKKVSPLPNQRQQYLNPNLKVYNTDIEIQGDVKSLRNGMSCKVEIVVEELEDAVYVPVQSVTRVSGQSVVFIKFNNQVEMRTVTIGLDNNRMIHIKQGLKEGEYVLLKPPLNYQDMKDDKLPFPTKEKEIASIIHE